MPDGVLAKDRRLARVRIVTAKPDRDFSNDIRSIFERYNIVSEGDLRTAAAQLSGLTGTKRDNPRRARIDEGGKS
jgi:hypothetical protein